MAWWAALRKELAVLWLSPLPYVVGALFHLVVGVLYVEQLDVRGQALFQPMFPIAGFMLIALVPLLAMRAFAEESAAGSLPLLLASPVPARRLVTTKWAAAWITALVPIALLAVDFVLVSRWGDPDSGPAIAGVLGLVLVAAAMAGIGVAASAATSSQAVAGMVAFFTGMLLWFSHVGSDTWAGGGVLAHFSLSERIRSFSAGVIDASDLGILVLLTVAALAAAALIIGPRVARRGAGSGPRVPRLAMAALLLVALVAFDRGVALAQARWDLTAESSLTLSAETQEVIAAVDDRVEAIAFVSRASPLRTQTAALLERYRDLNRRISFRLEDPERSPAAAVQLGIDPATGGVVFRRGDRSQTAALASEQDLTSALARLLRDESPGVCFTVGHGEADPSGSTEADSGAAAGSLVANGYRVRAVNLLADPALPDGCEGLVVANPVVPLSPEAVAAISAYLAGGGRALITVDPISTADLNPLVRPYGITIERGLVVEGDAGSRLGPDPLTLVVRQFRSPSPVVRRLPPVLFSGAVGLTTESDAGAGLAADPLATSSSSSFLERDPSGGQPSGDGLRPKFDASVDISGPVPIAAGADKSTRSGGGVVRTRLVVVGDADWLTNGFLGEGGGSRLFIQAMDWLTLDQDLVSVSTNLAAFRPLELSPARLSLARGILAGGLPALFVLSGLGTWLRRRRL
jgi:hypothetical protein